MLARTKVEACAEPSPRLPRGAARTPPAAFHTTRVLLATVKTQSIKMVRRWRVPFFTQHKAPVDSSNTIYEVAGVSTARLSEIEPLGSEALVVRNAGQATSGFSVCPRGCRYSVQ